MIGLLAACGGDDGPGLVDGGDDQIDSGTPPGCNPVAQTGCADGEKCTWQDVTETLGRIACVPDGTVAIGDACTFMEPGETAGYDNCVAGAYCLSGLCAEICTDAPDSCDTTTQACSSYSGLFEGAEVSTGVCDFLCDPGPQIRLLDDAPDCGGTTERPRGCYGNAWGSMPIEYSCTPDISDAQHGDLPDPLTPGDMRPYLNSCDAGYFPYFESFEDSAPYACIAFCTPGETHSGDTTNVDGVGQFTCANREALDAANFMECRYLHIFDQTPDTKYNNSGVCFATNLYQADWDGETGPDPVGPMPRCTQLSNTTLIDISNPPDGVGDIPEHMYWGCAPWMDPAPFAPGTKIGGFRAILEDKLRDALKHQGRPANVH